MDKEQAVRVATDFNKWRRGEDNWPGTLTSLDIGIAIDVLIEFASKKNEIAEAIRDTAILMPPSYLGDAECDIVYSFMSRTDHIQYNHIRYNQSVDNFQFEMFFLFVAEAIES